MTGANELAAAEQNHARALKDVGGKTEALEQARRDENAAKLRRDEATAAVDAEPAESSKLDALLLKATTEKARLEKFQGARIRAERDLEAAKSAAQATGQKLAEVRYRALREERDACQEAVLGEWRAFVRRSTVPLIRVLGLNHQGKAAELAAGLPNTGPACGSKFEHPSSLFRVVQADQEVARFLFAIGRLVDLGRLAEAKRFAEGEVTEVEAFHGAQL
jgi:hypothetical protein